MGAHRGGQVVSRIVQGNGAQVLPDVDDPQATIAGYFAHLAAEADLRVKYGTYRALAEALTVEAT